MAESGTDQKQVTGDTESKTTALAALLESDLRGNEAILTATVSLSIAALTYLGLTVFAVGEVGVPLVLLAFLPLPLIALQIFQMVLATITMRRAISASIIEKELVFIAGLGKEYEAELVGTRSSEPFINVNAIRTGNRSAQPLRIFAAVAPYVIFYFLGLVYTTYILGLYFVRSSGTAGRPWFWALLVFYLLVWGAFIITAAIYFQDPQDTPESESPTLPAEVLSAPVRGSGDFLGPILVGVSILGVAFQVLQDEDPAPTFLYFTTLSAIGIAVSYWFSWANRRGAIVFWAATSAALVSAAVYWAAIFPSVGLPETVMGWLASFVLHIILPPLVLAQRKYGTRVWGFDPRAAPWTLLWPLTYAAVVLALQALFDLAAPYTFMDVREASLPVMLTAAVVVSILTLMAALSLLHISHQGERRGLIRR